MVGSATAGRVTVTLTDTVLLLLKLASSLLTWWLMVARPTEAPVTVISCGTLQLSLVKVTGPLTVAPAPELTGVTVTSSVGWSVRTTV